MTIHLKRRRSRLNHRRLRNHLSLLNLLNLRQILPSLILEESSRDVPDSLSEGEDPLSVPPDQAPVSIMSISPSFGLSGADVPPSPFEPCISRHATTIQLSNLESSFHQSPPRKHLARRRHPFTKIHLVRCIISINLLDITYLQNTEPLTMVNMISLDIVETTSTHMSRPTTVLWWAKEGSIRVCWSTWVVTGPALTSASISPAEASIYTNGPHTL